MESRFRAGCFYCEHNVTQQERMLPIVTFDTSTVFLIAIKLIQAA